MYTLLIAVIYLAFISLGLPDSLLGSAWPVLYTELNVPLSYMGILTMTVSACTIISSLISDKVTRKFGTAAVTVTSVFLTAFALLGYSYANSFWMLLVLSIPYGLGAGAIDAALNNYVAIHYSSKHMSWLHCFWGVGTIASPAIMSYSLANYNWSIGYRAVAAVQLAIGAILLLTTPLWKVNSFKSEEVKAKAKSIGIMNTLKISGVKTLLLGFFCYCALESTAMNWSATYLVAAKGFNESDAAGIAALVFLGITVGRFLSGFFMEKLGNLKMIRLGTIIISVGAVLLILPFGIDTFYLVGLFVIGLGCAPIYPCIINSTPSNFGAENSGAIIGIQMASAYLGSMLMPTLFGIIAKETTFELYPLYILIFNIILVVMIDITFAITARKNK